MGCINSTNKQKYTFKRDDIFNVSVVRVQSNQSVMLASHGFLEITSHELVFIASNQEPVVWSLQHLRRYGLTGNIFSFEAGRRCPTGPGIYTFRCCNAEELYAKFQSRIISLSVLGERINSSVHSSNIFPHAGILQQNTNQYLEPTSVQGAVSIEDRPTLADTHSNTSNDLNHSLSDSLQSTSFAAEIPSCIASYSNINTSSYSFVSSSNVYMEQPRKTDNEYNNNLCIHELRDSWNAKRHVTGVTSLLKSSSLDVPPNERAPILRPNTVETQRLYVNISTSQKTYNNSAERSYANIDVLPQFDVTQNGEIKSCQTNFVKGQDRHQTLPNGQNVNYIILDLDQPRSPSQCSMKNEFGSGQSLSSRSVNIKTDDLFTSASSHCGSSTMPKSSTINEKNAKLVGSKMEQSGSYTRIDFLKTFALMKSSTNYTDVDLDNDQEESRITRHSKLGRKAYSISE